MIPFMPIPSKPMGLPPPSQPIQPSNTRQLLSAELAETKRQLQRQWLAAGGPEVSAIGEAAGCVDVDEWRAQLVRLERGEQPPWGACVEEFVVPDSDPRRGLVGQRGVRVRRRIPERAGGEQKSFVGSAAAGIPAGAVLFHYSGMVRTLEEFDAVYDDPLSNGYVFLMWRRATGVDSSKARGLSVLFVDAWDGGNTGCMINDYRENPLNDPGTAGLLEQRQAAARVTPSRNVQFVRVHNKGWPYMFIVATRELLEGEELFLDYGEQYWSRRREAQPRRT
eukprot:COSAG02_NODE_401_length_23083_cov_26.955839_3_plen_279_part_00